MRVPLTHLIAYTTALLTGGVGVAVLAGFVAPTAPREFRITLGLVLILLAIYRVVITRVRAREE
jgi:hypothetical protein